MSQTPYQQKLWVQVRNAHTDRKRDIETTLMRMIAALENDRYDELSGLYGSLTESWKAQLGRPPRSRVEDR